MTLTRRDTNVMKGIAICAMLTHHLWGCPIEGIQPYNGVLLWLGTLGKVCVALFLFCSGYGLAANYQPLTIKEDFKFISHRLVKFYLNYWVIFLIFVPITIFVFPRPLSAAYGDNYVWWHLILDIVGLQGFHSYNTTWWFNKLIIILYLLFPILYRTIRWKPWIAILVGIVVMRLSTHVPYDEVDLCIYQFPFVLGIVWKLYESKGARIQKRLEKHRGVAVCISVGLLIVTLAIRMYPVIPHWSGVRMDGFLSCAITLCVITILRHLSHVMDVLSFLGKHSMNIYLIHTFINGYWYPEWLHTCEWMRGGGNFIVLIIICLLFSIIVEFLKEKIRLYELVNIITQRI